MDFLLLVLVSPCPYKDQNKVYAYEIPRPIRIRDVGIYRSSAGVGRYGTFGPIWPKVWAWVIFKPFFT